MAAVDPAEVNADEQLSFLATTGGRLGVTVTLFRLPGAAPAHAVLAAATGGARRRWSVAACLDPRDAAVTALRDAVGQAQLDAEGIGFDLGPDLLADFDPAALKVDGAQPPPPAVASVEDLLAALAAGGRQALRVLTTTPDLDLVEVVHTVRVLLVDAR
ncbi:hypothetical protein ACFQZ4_50500 [Catellatospora coxensis]